MFGCCENEVETFAEIVPFPLVKLADLLELVQ